MLIGITSDQLILSYGISIKYATVIFHITLIF